MKFLTKNIVPVFAFIAFIVIAIVAGCTSSAQKVEEAKDDVTDAKEDLTKAQNEYFAEIEAFRAETANKIADNDKIIAEFRVKIAKEKASVRDGYQEKITELEGKNAAMKLRIVDYKETDKEKWQAFKKEFAHDMDELGQALDGLVVSSKK